MIGVSHAEGFRCARHRRRPGSVRPDHDHTVMVGQTTSALFLDNPRNADEGGLLTAMSAFLDQSG